MCDFVHYSHRDRSTRLPGDPPTTTIGLGVGRVVLKHNILPAELEPGVRPSVDVLAQCRLSCFPFFTVNSTVGFRYPVLVAHREETQAAETIAFKERAKRFK